MGIYLFPVLCAFEAKHMIETIKQVRFPGKEWLLRLLRRAPRYPGQI